ncbi:hypothetical protein QMY50_00153 (plasmid) [Escherichia coli]|nr:hypothetical protein QMY50_00153 [Escherichia coli]
MLGQPIPSELKEKGLIWFLRKRKLTTVCSHQTKIGNLDAHLI